MKLFRRLLILPALLVASLAHAQTFNLFKPANGVLKGSTTTYVTTAATSSDITGMWSGTCNVSSFLRGDGTCAAPSGSGTVTSVALTMPSGFSVGGSPVTTTGTLAVTTTLSGVLKGNGSGFTTSAASDIYGLWSGTCSSSNYLRGDGTCAAPGTGSPGGANTQVQFNNAGSFSGAAGMTWDGTTFTATNVAGIGTTLTALNASNLGSGTVPDARFPATLPALSGVNLTALNATNVASGTLNNSRLPATINAATDVQVGGVSLCRSNGTNCAAPGAGGSTTQVQYNSSGALSGSAAFTWNNGTSTLTATNVAGAGTALTALNASNLGSGTVPDARFPATLPAASGANLTALNASNISTGTLANARLPATINVGTALQVSSVDVCLSSGTNCPALSSNVALKNAANTFSASQSIGTSSGTTLALTSPTGASVPLTVTNGTVNGQLDFGGGVFEVGTTSNHALNLYTNNATKVSIAAAGNVAINAPSSGDTLTLSPASGASTLKLQAASAATQNTLSFAQTSGGAWAIYQPASSTSLRIFDGADRATFTTGGGLQLGAPTGGDKGAGTLNTAGTIYENNVAVCLSSGTNCPALSSNVALKNAANTFTAAQNITTSSGVALTVTGVANSRAATIIGDATAGQSYGLKVQAGTNSTDEAFAVFDQTNSTKYLTVFGDGGLTVGSTPTGGDKGAGTLNTAGTIYENNVAVCKSNGTNCPSSSGPAIKRASMTVSGGACTLVTNTGVSSCTYNGPGDYTVNFTSSFGANGPTCVANGAVGSPIPYYIIAPQPAVASSARFGFYNASSVSTDVAAWNVICIGT